MWNFQDEYLKEKTRMGGVGSKLNPWTIYHLIQEYL